MRGLLVALVAAPLLAGCGTLIKDRSQVPTPPVGGFGTPMGSHRTRPPTPDWRKTGEAAQPGDERPEWRNADVIALDLIGLIDAHAGGYRTPQATRTFEEALGDFDRYAGEREKEGRAARNAIVGAVMMASDKNCDVYLEYFHGNQIAIRSISSVASAVLVGAAPVTQPERSSKLLAALGAISSDVGGKLDQAAFSSRAAEVIVAGIRAERAALRAAISRKMTDGYAAWPLSLALGEALAYHGRCNAISGLSYLQGKAEQVKRQSETPATEAFNASAAATPTR